MGIKWRDKSQEVPGNRFGDQVPMRFFHRTTIVEQVERVLNAIGTQVELGLNIRAHFRGHIGFNKCPKLPCERIPSTVEIRGTGAE